MEVVAVEAPDTSQVAAGRRGLLLQPRKRREINVRKALGEDPKSERPITSAVVPMDTQQGNTGSSITNNMTVAIPVVEKFKPKLYVPDRLKGTDGSTGSNSANSYLEQFASGHQEPTVYSSRVIPGLNAPAAEEAKSGVSTSRGVFKLRQRRNIRVKSFDDLDDDGPPKEAPRHVEPRREYTPIVRTGFLSDTSAKDKLARRERHSVDDMLGSGSATSYEPTGYTGLHESMHQPVEVELDPSRDPTLAMEGDISDGLVPEFVDPYQPNISQYPASSQLVPHDDHLIHNGGEYGEPGLAVNGVDDPLFIPSQAPYIPNGDPFMADPLPQLIPAPTTDTYQDRLAAIRSQIHAAPPATTPDDGHREESIDEKKERILRNLMMSKMDAAAVARPTDPNFETLEQKKERIFAQLRQKHSGNIQAQELIQNTAYSSRAHGFDILGLSSTPSPYSRSLSLGATLDSEPSQLVGIEPRTDIFSQTVLEPESTTYQSAISRDSSQIPVNAHNSMFMNEAAKTQRNTHTSSYASMLSRKPVSEQIVQNQKDKPTAPNAEEAGIFRNGDYDKSGSYERLRGSPSEDICSVDSGFHGGDMAREDSPPTNGTSPNTKQESPRRDRSMSRDRRADMKARSVSRERKKESKPASDNCKKPTKPVSKPSTRAAETKNPTKISATKVTKKPNPPNPLWKAIEKEGEDSSEETLIKPSDVKAAAGNMLLKKSAPPTKPKPGAKPAESKPVQAKPPTPQKAHQSRSQTPVKSQPPRPKSAPPSKSKSIANLNEVELSPRMERRVSVATTRDDLGDGSSPFSRNSRLRSSTKAWEIKQAEKQAEVRSRRASVTAPAKTPTKSSTPKRPSTPIKGQVSLSAEAAAAGREKPQHTPRASSNYDKPWRTGTALSKSGAGSFTIRSAQTEQRSIPDRQKKSPPSGGSSASSSRTQSPSGRPKNPVKGQGSVAMGCPRSPPKLAQAHSPTQGYEKKTNSKFERTSRTPSPNKPPLPKPKRTTPKPFKFSYIPRHRRSSMSSDAGSDVGSDIDDFIRDERSVDDEEHNLSQLTEEWRNTPDSGLSLGSDRISPVDRNKLPILTDWINTPSGVDNEVSGENDSNRCEYNMAETSKYM